MKIPIAIISLLLGMSAGAQSTPASAPAAAAPQDTTAEMQLMLGLPQYALAQCRGGYGYFCDFLAGFLQNTDTRRLPALYSTDLKLDELAQRAFSADCDTEDPFGCFQLGMRLKERGLNPAEGQFLRAVKVCEQACAKPAWPGCLLPLALSRASDTTAAGEAKRVETLRLACAGGFTPACKNPAPDAFFTAMNSGAGLAQLGGASMLWLCQQGKAAHCSLLGWSELTGMPGVPADRAAALHNFRQACDANDGMGCQMTGFLYRSGLGAAKNAAEMNRALARACELKQGYACFILAGDLWDEAAKTMKDPPRAFTLLTASCTAENGPGCALLAKLYLTGSGAPKDPAKGKALIEQACQLKFTPACEILAKGG